MIFNLQQFEQLFKFFFILFKFIMLSLEIDEEIELRFVSMFLCYCVLIIKDERIIDLGVFDYMLVNIFFVDYVYVYNKLKVSLINGKIFIILYFGRLKLNNEFVLNNVCVIKLDISI